MTPCLTFSASRLAKETCWFFNDGTHVPLCVDNNNMSMDPSILCACVSICVTFMSVSVSCVCVCASVSVCTCTVLCLCVFVLVLVFVFVGLILCCASALSLFDSICLHVLFVCLFVCYLSVRVFRSV